MTDALGPMGPAPGYPGSHNKFPNSVIASGFGN
ncbi:hypothetical protein FHT70_004932 [Rhizobium sp. BK049]|nr:hypothetical protein [Rhizobium sp. BK049]